jgi:hypothetical protein
VFERLRGDFGGYLVTDFCAAYNSYPGKHQRCWVHLLRLLHDLKERHPQDAAVRAWARAVRRLYDRAVAFVHATDPPTAAQRQAYYDRLVAISHRLGGPAPVCWTSNSSAWIARSARSPSVS